MMSFVLLTSSAMGWTFPNIPEYSFVEGESDLHLKVCNSTQIWKAGAFDWYQPIWSPRNLEGLATGTLVGPMIVREDMALTFDNIEDGPNIDDRDVNQAFENQWSLFQWYKKQLFECTEKCNNDSDCYATWAYMKNYQQDDPE